MQLKLVDKHQLNQHTLNRSISFIGRGLHTGINTRMTVFPAEPNTGYLFIRRDVPSLKAQIKGRWYSVTDTHLSTTVSNMQGVAVATVEHILAALYACGIDNAVISLDGPEVPSMDGSAQPFVDVIRPTGSVDQSVHRQVIMVTQPVNVREGNRCASLEPSPVPWINMEINFNHASIRRQTLSKSVDKITFCKEIAAARTFGFEEQIATLQELGFARGGTLHNAILLTKSGVANPAGLRFPDEFVRHKALDAIGDLALAGGPIIGQFNGYCSGHELNNRLLHELMSNSDCWQLTTMNGVRQYWRDRLLPLQRGKGELRECGE